MRNFDTAKRIVIKIGTATLSANGGVNTAYVRRMAGQVKALLEQGRQVIIVTSGAIGMGIGQLPAEHKAGNIQMRQACAAIGQPLLMHEYHKAFRRHGVAVAQVLLTAEVLTNRKTYLNLRHAIEALLKLGAVPVINENDSVSTDEIGSAFGDNDRLSALVASKIDADVLIMLSDIDGLYDKDPRQCPDARPVPVVYELTDAVLKYAGGKGSRYATGGMKTKFDAARIAADANCRMVLANGQTRNVLRRIIDGAEIGTVFLPRRNLSNRQRWILNSKPKGTIEIDTGAMRALRRKKSLLPSGIAAVRGDFKLGDVVMLNNEAKAVTAFDSGQLNTLAGKHSRQIKKLLGPGHREEISVPEDIVFLD